MADGRFLQRLRLILQQSQLGDAMRVLNDETHGGGLDAGTVQMLDVLRDHLNTAVLASRDAGNDEQQILRGLHRLAIQALRETRNQYEQRLERVSQAAFVEGDVPVPAPAAAAAAVHSLEEQTFRAAGGENDDDDDGVTECSICLVEFMDGGQVSVVPCPSASSRGHKFHQDCISRWLEIRNTCPLCRHKLPTAGAYDQ